MRIREECQLLTTFISHIGRFKWLRMPFGLTQAPAHFQKCMEEAVHGPGQLTGCAIYYDDVIIVGDSVEECMERTATAMERIKQAGAMINFRKSPICCKIAMALG